MYTVDSHVFVLQYTLSGTVHSESLRAGVRLWRWQMLSALEKVIFNPQMSGFIWTAETSTRLRGDDILSYPSKIQYK